MIFFSINLSISMLVYMHLAFSIVFLILVLVNSVKDLKKFKRISFLNWFNLSLVFFNGFIPSFVLFNLDRLSAINPIFYNHLIQLTPHNLIIFSIFNIFIIIFVNLGWNFHNRSFFKVVKKLKTNNPISIYNKTFIKSLFISSTFYFFISFLSYFIYTIPYGGFIGNLIYSEAIRAGLSPIPNPFTFLYGFGPLSYISAFLYFSLLFFDNKFKFLSLIGFLSSSLFSFYVLYSRLGRVSILLFFLTFIFFLVFLKFKNVKKLLFSLIFILFFSLILLFLVSDFLGRSSINSSIFEYFLKELSFPLVNFAVNIKNTEFRNFFDVLFFFVYVLPTSIWHSLFGIESASSFNTFLVTGFRKGEGGIYGEMPLDFLSFSYLQGGLISIIIISLLFGFFMAYFQRKLDLISLKPIKVMFQTIFIIYIIILIVPYGDSQHVMSRTFNVLFSLIFYNIFSKYIKYRLINYIY